MPNCVQTPAWRSSSATCTAAVETQHSQQTGQRGAGDDDHHSRTDLRVAPDHSCSQGDRSPVPRDRVGHGTQQTGSVRR